MKIISIAQTLQELGIAPLMSSKPRSCFPSCTFQHSFHVMNHARGSNTRHSPAGGRARKLTSSGNCLSAHLHAQKCAYGVCFVFFVVVVFKALHSSKYVYVVSAQFSYLTDSVVGGEGGGYEIQFSRDPFPGFSAGSHCEQFWRWHTSFKEQCNKLK